MPQVKVTIPTPLRLYTNNQKKVTVDGGDVDEVLLNLVQNYPDLRRHLFDGDNLVQYVNIYLNDEDIRYCDSKTVKDGDVISVVPSIAGGSNA